MSIIKYLASDNIFFLIFIGILSAEIGSFLNVIIYRLPIMMKQSFRQECNDFLNNDIPKKQEVFNLSFPRSQCPKCKTKIPFWYNLPVIGFIILRGKCHNCKSSISWGYPLVELLTIVASLFVVYKFGFTLQSVALLLLTWGLIPLIFIDFAEQFLPDSILLPLLWLGLLLSPLQLFTTPENAIFGAVFGYLSLWIVAKLFKLIRKIDGMGNGDFKLFALFGAWFGWQILPFIILLASLLGIAAGITLIMCKKLEFNKPMPFGPYIAFAGWFFIFYGEVAMRYFYRLFL